jgi:hypothetical protein
MYDLTITYPDGKIDVVEVTAAVDARSSMRVRPRAAARAHLSAGPIRAAWRCISGCESVAGMAFEDS